jgi:hypothetical protein
MQAAPLCVKLHEYDCWWEARYATLWAYSVTALQCRNVRACLPVFRMVRMVGSVAGAASCACAFWPSRLLLVLLWHWGVCAAFGWLAASSLIVHLRMPCFAAGNADR